MSPMPYEIEVCTSTNISTFYRLVFRALCPDLPPLDLCPWTPLEDSSHRLVPHLLHFKNMPLTGRSDNNFVPIPSNPVLNDKDKGIVICRMIV